MRTGLLVLIVLALPASARAQISPGELAEAHADLEGMKNCLKCHDLGEGPSATKCLACHKEIQTQLDARKGFHHRVVAGGNACFECHGEHAGRKFELVHWPDGRQRFDHSQTGWALRGAHVRAGCRDCHRADRVDRRFASAHPTVDATSTFLGLDGDCLGCHADTHKGQFERACTSCHVQDAWKPAGRFDHARAVFPLVGRHAAAECSKCHPTSPDDSKVIRYAGIRHSSCSACHTDPHSGRLGNDCASCHGQEAWKPVTKFDHVRTAFPLTGKHALVACVKCHRNIESEAVEAARFAALAHDNCTPCHADPHQARLGNDCASCHGTHGWRQGSPTDYARFDHGRTRFALIGRHATVSCDKCHKDQSMTTAIEYDACDKCHADAHENQFAHRATGAACENCHDENGFTPARFTVADHSRTRFAIAGAHLAQPCVACHRLAEFPSGNTCRRFVFENTGCETCHADVHAGQFAATSPMKRCAECHVDTTWRGFGFDHDMNTRYRLEGKHRRARCDGCHVEASEKGTSYVRYRGTPTSCEACHAGQELQLGGTR